MHTSEELNSGRGMFLPGLLAFNFGIPLEILVDVSEDVKILM